jgi:hypothetical protein
MRQRGRIGRRGHADANGSIRYTRLLVEDRCGIKVLPKLGLNEILPHASELSRLVVSVRPTAVQASDTVGSGAHIDQWQLSLSRVIVALPP